MTQHTTNTSPSCTLDDLEDDLSLSSTDGMSLDDLLTESLAAKRTSNDVKVGRQLLAKGGLSQIERDSINKSVRDWELRTEWKPVASVVMFARQQCQGCGSFHKNFLGYFQRQEHKTTKVARWVQSTKPVDGKLLREAKYQDSHCDLCEDCADLVGYPVEEA